MAVKVQWRAAVRLVGAVLRWFSLSLLVPLPVALSVGEDLLPFLAAAAVSLSFGAAFERAGAGSGELRAREGFLAVSGVWLATAVVGAIPFLVAGTGVFADPVNALFESMSGITTTGATVIVSFDRHGAALLLWRQLIQWLGGLGILILATAVLTQLSVGGAQLMEQESQLTDVQKLTPRIVDTARLIWKIYLALTALTVAALLSLALVGAAPEMTVYDAVAHALTSVSTSGFSPEGRSAGAFSPAVQWLLVGSMFLGATSFVLLYRFALGDFDRLRRSEEFRFYVAVIVVVSAAVWGTLVTAPPTAGSEAPLRHAVFQVVSIVTTTGYATVDFTAWPTAAKHLLFVCMFVGGMAGSTTCSVKAIRWLVVLKGFRRDLFTAVHPEAVKPVRVSGNAIDEGTVRDIYAYTLISLVIFALAALLVIGDASRAGVELTEFEALAATAATFFNIGPAFGIAGPFGTYAAFPRSTRLLMTGLMWVGRVEIVPVLVLLTPAYWRS